MELKTTLKISILVYLLGVLFFYSKEGGESALWFGVGGGLAAVNVFFAAWVVRNGLSSFQSKGVFLSLVLAKSFSFLTVVAGILMFLKPLLLPFTLGLGIVIFSSIIAAAWEIRRQLKKTEGSQIDVRK